jgi:hypothetical protein
MAGVRGDGSTLAFEPASSLSLTTSSNGITNTNDKKPSLSFTLGKGKVAAKKVMNVSQDGRDDSNSNRMSVDSLSAGTLEQYVTISVSCHHCYHTLHGHHKDVIYHNGMSMVDVWCGWCHRLQRIEVKKQIIIPMIKNNWRGLEQVKADAIAAAAKLAQVSVTGDPNDIKVSLYDSSHVTMVPLRCTHELVDDWQPQQQDAVKKALEEGRVKKEKTENESENGDIKPVIKTEDQLAAEALLAEAKAIEEQGELPILMQNMVPGIQVCISPPLSSCLSLIHGVQSLTTEEERLRHDLDHRPDDLDLSHPDSVRRYEETPIEAFGLGMLIGMGWTPGGNIGSGKNQTVVEPIEYIPRAHLMGLGASMAKPSDKKQKKYIKPGESRDPKQQMRVQPGEDGKVKHFRTLSQRLIPVHSMRMRTGALIEITNGPHARLYARVNRFKEGTDDPDGAIELRLNVSNELVLVSRHQFEILDENALPTDHPALKSGSDKKSSSSASSSSSSSKSRDDDDKRKKKGDKRSRSRSPQRSSRETDKEREKRRKKEKEREKEKAEKAADKKKKVVYPCMIASSSVKCTHHCCADVRQLQDDDDRIKWVVAGIRVRVVSQSLCGGTLYQKKGRVEDVMDTSRFIIVMDGDRKIIEGVKEKYVETALPKVGGRVRVLRGEHKGVIGALVERNSDTSMALVQTEDSDMLRISFDDIAEWVGRS